MKDEQVTQFGRRNKKTRKSPGINQLDFARTIHVSNSFLSDVKRDIKKTGKKREKVVEMGVTNNEQRHIFFNTK